MAEQGYGRMKVVFASGALALATGLAGCASVPRQAASVSVPAAPALSPAAIAAAEWRTLPTAAYPGKRDDIAFADATHGWYGTGKGDLFATSDGGESWAKIASKPGTFIRALGFVDSRTGFIGNVGTGYYPGVTDTVPLYRTDDGGVSWTPVDLGGATMEGVCAIDIVRTQAIYQGTLQDRTIITAGGRVGGPAALIRSEDGGQSWRVIDLNAQTGMILDVHFRDAQVGFVAASSDRDVKSANAQILMTRDGGRTWREVFRTARPAELVWKMAWPSATVGYATVQSYDRDNPDKVVAKTVDGGLTWTELPLVSDPKAVELGIGFVDEMHGWVGSTAGGFATVDGGRSWTPAPVAVAANKFRMVPTPGGAMSVYAIGTEVQRLSIGR